MRTCSILFASVFLIVFSSVGLSADITTGLVGLWAFEGDLNDTNPTPGADLNHGVEMFNAPPGTVEANPLAVLLPPPPIVDFSSLAVLCDPPSTVASNPLAVFVAPPPIVDFSPIAILEAPPAIVE